MPSNFQSSFYFFKHTFQTYLQDVWVADVNQIWSSAGNAIESFGIRLLPVIKVYNRESGLTISYDNYVNICIIMANYTRVVDWNNYLLSVLSPEVTSIRSS